jgi:hypothetical protein
MSWFDIIKGGWLSAKRLKAVRECIEDFEGMELIDTRLSKTGHPVIKLKYTGEDLLLGMTEAIINVTVNITKRYGPTRTCKEIKSRSRKELFRVHKIIIGEW